MNFKNYFFLKKKFNRIKYFIEVFSIVLIIKKKKNYIKKKN